MRRVISVVQQLKELRRSSAAGDAAVREAARARETLQQAIAAIGPRPPAATNLSVEESGDGTVSPAASPNRQVCDDDGGTRRTKGRPSAVALKDLAEAVRRRLVKMAEEVDRLEQALATTR